MSGVGSEGLVEKRGKFTTSVTEWVVQCFMRDGTVHTGSPKTSREEAQKSGERLERINGAEWWLARRVRVVTVETSPWIRVPGTSEGEGA